MKSVRVVALLMACAAAPMLAGVDAREALASPEPPVLVAQADSDVRYVADVYVNFLRPSFPNQAYQNRADNGFVSEDWWMPPAHQDRSVWVPRKTELCQVLAAIQGYTRYAESYDDVVKGIAQLKRAASSGGYMPTIAGHPNIISDLQQLNLPTKLPSWEKIVSGSRELIEGGRTSSSIMVFKDKNIWDKLQTGLGSIKQIDVWLDEVFRPITFRTRAGKKPPR